ncbi:MAG: carboxypeptidase regulatory-like domain-containing protein [bacterium]|nr:carboxypeptidase regulatory-like domain-containing protein [bacterium]
MKPAALTCCILCFSLPSLAFDTALAEALFAPVGTTGGVGDALSVHSDNPALTRIALNDSRIEFTEQISGFRLGTVATLVGEPLHIAPGAPAVPGLSRLYRVADMGGVELRIVAAEYDVIDDYDALPYPEDVAGSLQFSQDPVFYSADVWYPPDAATMSAPMIMRDFRVVNVTLFPVQVNPVTRQARVYHTLEVELIGNSEPGLNELTAPRRISGEYAALYREFIRNLDEDVLDDVTTAPGTYLIVARDQASVNPWTDSLAAWRSRCGYDVIVHRFATSPSAGVLRSTILDYYENTATPLEHVCIMGDPSSSFGLPTSGNGQLDQFFALLGGNDLLPDVSIGRISATSSSEFATAWRKLMMYERETLVNDTNWTARALLYAIVGMEQPNNLFAVQWADRQLRQYTGIQDNVVSYAVSIADQNYLCEQFSEGIGLFYYAGYWVGSLQSFWHMCTNAWRHPVSILMAGGTGGFDYQTCLAEEFVLAGTANTPKGAVAAIGYSSLDENATYFQTFGGGFINAMSQLGIERTGSCHLAGIITLAQTYGIGNSEYTTRVGHTNVIGDPALRMWTDTPTIITAAHSTALPIGARQLTVTVSDTLTDLPVAAALVVVIEGDGDVCRALTDSSGAATLPLTVDSAGTISVTVTKMNHKPYLADIACGNIGVWVALDSVAIDDDNINGTVGNADGEFNPGEVIDLTMRIKNFGETITETGIQAELASLSEYFTVLSAPINYPDLEPGMLAVPGSAFRVQVSQLMNHGAQGTLRLTVQGDHQATESVVSYTALAGKPEYVAHEILGGAWQPGTARELVVTLANVGAQPLSGTSATLTSLNPLARVMDANGTFGDVQVGGTASNGGNSFSIAADSLMYNGARVQFRMIVETSAGQRDTVVFMVPLGTRSPTDPCGPDALGYYSYDDSDMAYPQELEFDYVDLSGGLGIDLNIEDPGEKTQITQNWTSLRALPFSFTFYDQTFDSITICSNGWAAFGNETWTDTPLNRPLPAILAPANMVAIYWDDLKTSGAGQGVWTYYDEEHHAFIVQWKASGGGYTYSDASLDFQLLLLDPIAYPSVGGNGKLLFMYNDITMDLLASTSDDIPGVTIGIHDALAERGLELARGATYAPGCANVVDGRRILIDADFRTSLGTVAGQITSEGTGEPIAGAVIRVANHVAFDSTDAGGFYHIDEVLAGTRALIVSRRGFNDAVVPEVMVYFDSTTTVNISMLHPEVAVSPDSLRLAIAESLQTQVGVEIGNGGNGPLDFSISTAYFVNGVPVPPMGVLQETNVTTLTNDPHILGCEYADGRWYACGSSGPSGANSIYVFGGDGSLLDTLAQPATDPIGWFDMCFDGQYLYGSPQELWQIQGIDLNGLWTVTIPFTQLSPGRALAYDPATDHFWAADMYSDLYEVDRDGELMSTIENVLNLPIAGLSWIRDDVEGFSLLASCSAAETGSNSLWRINPLTHEMRQVATLTGRDGDLATGCAVTTAWNGMLTTVGTIRNNPNGDRLVLNQLEYQTDWLTVTPLSGTVSASGSLPLTLTVDGTSLPSGLYRPGVLLHCPVLDSTVVVPIELTVQQSGTGAGIAPVPLQFSLRPSYPNPFNPATTIPYSLPVTARTELVIYNVVGAQVAVLVNEVQNAGDHAAVFDGRTLPSGIYFARLRSGNFMMTTKMILLK